MFYKISEVHFRLLGTNGFHVKAKNEIYSCELVLSLEPQMWNFTSSLGRQRGTLHQKACPTCSTIMFLHSTNQIIDFWYCRYRCCRPYIALNSPNGETFALFFISIL